MFMVYIFMKINQKIKFFKESKQQLVLESPIWNLGFDFVIFFFIFFKYMIDTIITEVKFWKSCFNGGLFRNLKSIVARSESKACLIKTTSMGSN